MAGLSALATKAVGVDFWGGLTTSEDGDSDKLDEFFGYAGRLFGLFGHVTEVRYYADKVR